MEEKGIIVELIGDAVFAAEELGIKEYDVLEHMFDDSGFLLVRGDAELNPKDGSAPYVANSLKVAQSTVEAAQCFGDITEPTLTIQDAMALGYLKN